MHAPVEAGEKHHVHLGEQGRDVGDDFHTVLRPDVPGELIDAADAVGDVLAAPLVCRHHARPRDVVRRVGVAIEQAGERGNVRGIGADHAHPQFRGWPGGRGAEGAGQ